ncbi:hypothetical protein LTR78_005059 [Recurvomyces mirabilis]|uniref:Uncharacterized protein n=1 Tax=Recurvomyces mirabilis TaxID=574656 RepID=A0AAE0WP10_9PEZI|nr:hypothetical protein LTR78_005059 [Recurvomyces mirabilis]KAK5158325.1 hypothetical protein LTS14_003343 [Recurvomyces mirabilis]
MAMSNQRRRPETLLAILLLDYAETIRNVHPSRITTSVHYQGAIALLEQYECESSKTGKAHPLASAAIHRAFFNALHKLPSPETPVRDGTAITPTGALNPVLLMDDVIGRTLAFCRSTQSNEEYVDRTNDIIQLGQILGSWYLTIPASWTVVSKQVPTTTRSDVPYDHYPSLDIASLFCQGYCARILINELERRASVPAVAERASTATLVNRIFASVPFLLGVAKRSRDTGPRFCSTMQTWTAPAPLKWCEEEFVGEFLGLWHIINILRFLDHILSNSIPGIPRVEACPRTARAVKDQLQAVKSRFRLVDPLSLPNFVRP